MFKYIILGVAFFIASCAAIFSITGIGQLFLGAHISVMLMATSLEAGKLVTVSFLFRYWAAFSKILRNYFIFAAIVISGITSTGIYGYLSAAYAKSAVEYKVQQNKIEILTTQQQGINNLLSENQKSIELNRASVTRQEIRSDSLVGKSGFITQQRNIAQSNSNLQKLQQENAKLIKIRDSLESIKVQRTGELVTNSKIGTFNYVASVLNVSLDTVAKWFILIIVFVFDPLSLSLIIAYNIARTHEQMAIPASTTLSESIKTDSKPPRAEEIQTAVETPIDRKTLSPLPPEPQLEPQAQPKPPEPHDLGKLKEAVPIS
jgi:hypothetical protein